MSKKTKMLSRIDVEVAFCTCLICRNVVLDSMRLRTFATPKNDKDPGLAEALALSKSFDQMKEIESWSWNKCTEVNLCA